MNNLKRVLSLGLAGTMLAGMMMVGASAASKDFSDAADIQNTDAVNTMVALGVIKGKDTGAFDPAGNVTRGEMAKMICVAINSGNEPVLGTKATPTYTDIKGHWAESYIEYCASMGYVAGRGDGTFAPDATVTSTEAAKMILTTMGYKAEVSGFTGIDWSINTNSQANQSGLYKSLSSIDTAAPMSRDNAAQMLYNALDAKTVELNPNGTDYKTSTYTYTGTEQVAVSSEKVYVFDAIDPGTAGKYDELKALNGEEYTSYADALAAAQAIVAAAALNKDYTLDSTTKVIYGNQSVTKTKDETFGHKFLSLDTYNEDKVYLTKVEEDSKGTYTVTLSDGASFTKVADDYSALMGEKVKVLSKASDDVYGVFASGGAGLATGVVGNIASGSSVKAGDTSIKIDGTSYKVENTVAKTPMYAFNNFGTDTTSVATDTVLNALPANKAAAIKVVDLDGNGKIDLVVYTPFTVAKVTYVGSTSFTAGGKTVKFDDANTYDGMAKNDYVMVVKAANTVDDTDTYTKITEIVTGDITSTKSSGADFKVDGAWYSMAADSLLVSGSAKTASAGGKVSKAVVVNGYAFYLDTSKTVEAKDYAVVVTAVGSDDNGMLGDQAKLLFTDGTEKVVDTDADYSTKSGTTKLEGTLVTYEIEDGDYKLTAAIKTNGAGDADKAGFDEVLTTLTYKYAKNNKSTVGGNYIAEDAVVFVKNSKGKFSVVSGATMMKMPDGTTVTNAYADKDSTTGYKTVSLAFVTGDVTSADMQYGYVVSAIEEIKNDDGKMATFDIFNGTEKVRVTTTNTYASLIADKSAAGDTTAAGLAKNTVIAYVADGNGIDVKNVYTLTKDTAEIGAIISYNGSDEFSYMTGAGTETIEGYADPVNVIKKDGTEKPRIEIDKDTVILTINVADKEGVAGGELALADTTPGGNYYANVLVLSSTGTTADLIVYCNDILNVIG